ncbi:hypothetical protein QOT17_011190 [Balamuthia mandrillaris]
MSAELPRDQADAMKLTDETTDRGTTSATPQQKTTRKRAAALTMRETGAAAGLSRSYGNTHAPASSATLRHSRPAAAAARYSISSPLNTDLLAQSSIPSVPTPSPLSLSSGGKALRRQVLSLQTRLDQMHDKQNSPTAASTPSSASHNFSSLIKFSPNHTNNPPPKPKPYLITPLPLAEAATTAELSLSPSRLRRCSIDRSPGRTPQRPKNHHSKHTSTHDSVLLQALKSRFPSVYNLHLLSERRKSISCSDDVASSKSNLTTYALPSPSASCASSSSLSPSSSFLFPSLSPRSQQTTEDSIINTSKPSPAASTTIDESTPKKKEKQRKDRQNNKIRKDKIGVSPQGSAIKKQRRGSDALYAHLLRGARITASAHKQQKASELTSVALPSPSNSRTQSVVSQNEHNDNGREQASDDATSKQHEEHTSTPFSPFSSPLSISLPSAWKSAPRGVEANEETPIEVGEEEKEQTQETAQQPEANSGVETHTKKQKRFSRQIVSPTPAATASSSSFLHSRPTTLRVRSKRQGGSGPASTLRKALSRGNHFSSTPFSSDKYDHLAFYNESDEESVHPSQEECSSSSSASSLEVAAALLHHQLSSSSSPSSSATKRRQADAIKPNPSLTTTTTTGSSSPSGKGLAKAFGSTAKRLKTSALAVNSNKNNNDNATSSAKKKKRTRKNKKMRNKNKYSVANKENIGC